MVITWLLDAALVVIGWFLAPFEALATLSLPAPLNVVVPVPIVANSVGALNVWFPIAVIVALALVAGRVAQWLYGLIPFKAT